MSSIYKVGARVVCPSAKSYGDKGNVIGSIESYKYENNTPFVKWNDGIEGYTKPSYLITKEKYEQLRNAGFTDSQISEYVRTFDGHIYN